MSTTFRSLTFVLLALLESAALFGVPAQDSFLLKDLDGSVVIDFHGVLIPKDTSSVELVSPARPRPGTDIRDRTTCLLSLKAASPSVQVLQRSITFVQSRVDNERGGFILYSRDPRVSSLWCRNERSRPDTVWFRSDVPETVQNVRQAFGVADDGQPKVRVHLGAHNTAHASSSRTFDTARGTEPVPQRNLPLPGRPRNEDVHL